MHPGSPPPPPPNNQVGATLPILVGGLALLLLAGIIAGAMIISSDLENGGPGLSAASSSPSSVPSATSSPSAPAAPASASPSPTPSTSEDPLHDSCLIGTWQETSHDTDTTIDGVKMRLHSWGAVQHFRADGTLEVRYGDRGINARAKVNNRTYEVITTGRMTYNWQTNGGQILYSNSKATGTVIWRQSGKETGRAPLSGSIDPERYTCGGDSLRQFGPTWTIELRRINTAPL
ncbi:hypothetical protein RB614_32530 [Phytohabitans sp. ZYX-F-186]|uniref:Lipocalin-like domain-containing protein n=1 Tax=Phytohabitans maris TaxID=3071409 RepID=A0ABU0ZQD5_9ACTN|nr:hypothetical protein [Phytohabitans sp. ZYX-F-186]MDQ7909258.1 hypothetical protein [Phytohabitans sp. ZYX-F-186]